MKLRTFIATLVGGAVAPWKSLGSVLSKQEEPPIQVFPKYPEQIVGLWAVQDWGGEKVTVHIIREFDEWTDRWNGEVLYNPRRNKFWCERDGKVELCIFDAMRYHVGPNPWDYEYEWNRDNKFYTSRPT